MMATAAKSSSTGKVDKTAKTAKAAKTAKVPKAAKVEKVEKAPRTAKVATGKSRGAKGTLVVVESPAKAKTIKKYLGRSFEVLASVGHIMDLPKSKLGVDVDHGFEPQYVVIRDKIKVVSDIKKAARNAEHILLATDPDREGEAIAWHLSMELGAPGGDDRIRRVLFNEITKSAILAAIEKPGELDRKKYDSQQARRILDRLVGYQISPILWKKVKRGLSAGRVQSVAVRLVVDREREIEAFVAVEYWTLDADLAASLPPEFRARLIKVDGRKAELTDGVTATGLAAELGQARFTVASVDRKERRRNAPPPFTTAKLQQEAANRLGFSAKKTMTLSQKLYEGVDLGEDGTTGLITYMRTDSVRIAPEAVESVRVHIAERYGKDYVPETPNVFKTKQKQAQEAHEAVRPTSIAFPPDKVALHLDAQGERDMSRLYELIWNRFVASQMLPAVYDQTAVDVQAGRATFRATGSVLKFPGYLAVYGETLPEDEAGAEPEKDAEEGAREKAEDRSLPPLEAGQDLRLVQLLPEQHFTQPPPRFNESSLIKELEEKGIGRPSTYASILSTIQDKGYVEKVERVFKPTHLGLVVTDELVKAFPSELDVAFTAGMEERLDEVEEGTVAWQTVLGEFWDRFKGDLAKAEEKMRDVKAQQTPTDVPCEKCGKMLVIKWGRNGEFLACPGYPECRNTMNFRREGDVIVPMKEEEVPCDEKCPECASPMVLKRGRFGRFFACTRYPECKGTKSVPLGVPCPKCGSDLSERRSRRGKTFYGCTTYPKCDFVSWDKPRAEKCPLCDNAWLVDKYSKRDGAVVACPNKECGYRRAGAEATPEAV
jgi:DNA topoisomerase-1